MSPKRFDQFYFIDDGQICSVDDVAEYADRYSGKIGKYEGKMYCPECRQAQLTFVHKTSKKKRTFGVYQVHSIKIIVPITTNMLCPIA